MTLDDAIAACPIMAILRGVRPEEILDIAEALFQAGVRAVEVPLNSPDPLSSISRLTQAYGGKMCCGAGTVLQPEDVDRIADAGGRVIVSPNVNPQVIGRTLQRGLEPAPGFATATEAFTAIDAGARHLKLFPAITHGPTHLKQLSAVLPKGVFVWAVGGVGVANLSDWRKAGARAFGIGGELYMPGQSAMETGEKAVKLAREAQMLPT